VIAALFVATGGTYYSPELAGICDPWDEARDARLYAGPHAVVAHPDCKRWGRYWFGGPSAKVRRKLGDDAGCFASALASVRAFGGVLEHPEASHAWPAFRLRRPPRAGGWIRAGMDDPGWTCCVEQGHYGHRARKPTWLYAVGCELPSFTWGASSAEGGAIDAGYHSAGERAAAREAGTLRGGGRMGATQRKATPLAFRDALIAMAQSVALDARARAGA